MIAEDYKFRGMHRRRLSAEQFVDAVSTVIYPIYADTLKHFDPWQKLPSRPSYPYARASLVKNDAFLTALGRPNRENVSTSRSSQANLLQALALTNGEAFNTALEAGAARWRERYATSEELIREVYLRALARHPEKEEMDTALEILGSSPGVEDIQDFLWAVMLLPEFQLIF